MKIRKTNTRKSENDKITQPDFLKNERKQKLNYPYIVIRYYAAVYQNIPVDFIADESESAYQSSFRIIIPEPYVSGRLTEKARMAVAAVAMHIVDTHGLRACAVFSEDDCVFCEKGGVMNESNTPPNCDIIFEKLWSNEGNSHCRSKTKRNIGGLI